MALNKQNFAGGFFLAVVTNIFINHSLTLKDDEGKPMYSALQRLPSLLAVIAGSFIYGIRNKDSGALGFAAGGLVVSLFHVGNAVYQGADFMNTGYALHPEL